MTFNASLLRSLIAATAALLLATLCIGTATSGSLNTSTTASRVA